MQKRIKFSMNLLKSTRTLKYRRLISVDVRFIYTFVKNFV
jgi:hypothetical protein